jgi:hypothetical protein
MALVLKGTLLLGLFFVLVNVIESRFS